MRSRPNRGGNQNKWLFKPFRLCFTRRLLWREPLSARAHIPRSSPRGCALIPLTFALLPRPLFFSRSFHREPSKLAPSVADQNRRQSVPVCIARTRPEVVAESDFPLL